jgi:hypothetical protein
MSVVPTGVDHPVDVADDDVDDRPEPRPEGELGGGQDGAEEGGRVPERLLQARQVGGVHAADALLERGGVDRERADVVEHQPLERRSDVGHAEDGVGRQLRQAQPEPQVLGREAPLVAEGLDVGADDDELVGDGAGERQVVLAERPGGELADHGARLHAEQHRPHHREQPAEQLGGRVAVGLVAGVGGRCRRTTPATARGARGSAGRRPASVGPTRRGSRGRR